MTDDLRPWAILMLSAGALFTGGLVWYAWERVWIWRRLDLRAFAVDFRRSVGKADPAMPILLVICGTATGVFALLAGGGSRTLALTAIGLLAMILLGSIVVAEPINSQVRRRAEGVVPPRPSNSGAAGRVSTSHARTWGWPRSCALSPPLPTHSQAREQRDASLDSQTTEQ